MEQYFENYARLEQQRWMVADRPRTEAFAKAIAEVVKPGDVVIDLGAGSGILSIFAAKAGAKKVIAVERSNMAHLARELIKQNGLEDIIEVFHGDAADLKLPEKADVLISEWLGHLAYVEGMFRSVMTTRDAWLKPSGKMIPASVDLLLAPIEDKELYYDYGPGFWQKKDLYGINFEGFTQRELDLGHANQLNINKKFLLSNGLTFHQLDTKTAQPGDEWGHGTLTFKMPRSCEVTGFIGWFSTMLSPNVVLDTSPLAPTTHWVQTHFPFPVQKLEDGAELVVKYSTDEAYEGPRLMEMILKSNGQEVRYAID